MKPILLSEATARYCDEKAATFLQSGFWGSFKSEFAWKPRYFRLDSDGAPLTVLERRLARGVSFAYVPRGPAFDPAQGEPAVSLGPLAESLRRLLPGTCVFLRFDPPWFRTGDGRDENSSPGFTPSSPFRRAALDIQPPDTTVLKLAGRSDEELLAGMKPKWRYNIRLAEKKDVQVSEESEIDALDVFYELYKETAVRDRIALHPKRYYSRLLELAREYGPEAPDFRIWIARHEGKALASIITVFRKDEAVYLYGASSGEARNLMPAYALQWAALRAARDSGCGYYDFYGIPPFDDPSHPMAGLYRFKTGFGGEVIHYPGSWDYPARPALYAGYRAAESLRRFWYKSVRKGRAVRAGT